MKIIEILNQLNIAFEQAGITSPEINSQYILMDRLEFSRTELFLHSSEEISNIDYQAILKSMNLRLKGQPLQYIIGKTEFYGFPFKVAPGVLIPRAETENLLEWIIAELSNKENLKILDIGTGSGCIAITLKKLLKKSKVTAVDISDKALKIAKNNAVFNNVSIEFFISNVFDTVEDSYDLIVSNPPYISKSEYNSLADEIKLYEPESALIAEDEGLFFYNKILEDAQQYLNPEGVLFFEIGANQGQAVKKLALKNNFNSIIIKQDLNNFDRYVRIK